ncbi:DUF2779 domain-containing protein [Euhalothece natronophila Z-M001]|uniref:DUF2779 domain-containing protein n=1 Tax=Euhalothece natronophila Z-M001 TaxID=522448 RepID=A0A5B8NSV0_9CHRO|nr:DUF2779 domain-containing protein [Euhalothece natronophila]QDZ41110.1 DUF2779 domain-containing protein [Euhalothece natronophila Z-M001]
MISFLTKSKLLSASQCQKRLWLETYQGEAREELSYSQQRRIEQGLEVGAYARQYFPQGTLIEGETIEDQIEQTQNAIEKGEKCLFEATFMFDNIVIRCDILLREESDKWQLIEVKSSTKVKDEHLQDLAIQKYVLAGNDLFLSNIQVMHINRDCVYPDFSNLLIREDVTQQIKGVFSNLPQLIRHSQNTLEREEIPDINIGKHCEKPYPCPFKSFCWEGIEEPTILSIPNLRGRRLDQINDLIAQGIYSLRDLPEDFPLTEKQAEAVREKLNPELMINEQGILEKFSQLEYPLYFFDFETLDPAIPRFEGLQPYQHFPFQYSCHILHQNGELEYHTYLHENETDPREKVIESLLETLGEKGSIIVYYQSFEAQRLGELAEQFPEYSTQLNQIKERLWDQWKIFKDDYQHPDFGGSTSLKKVLPVLVPEMSYDNLDIQGGDEAQALWDLVIQGKAGNQREKMLADLKAYSEQDTYAMVAIHQIFINQILPEMEGITNELLEKLKIVTEHSAGLETLKENLNSADQEIRLIALHQLHNYGEEGLKLLDLVSLEDREKLAQDKATSEEILSCLANDQSSWIREQVASNEKTPDYLLERLAEDEHYRVRAEVAINQKTPLTVLDWLIVDADYDVVEAVLDHPSYSVHRLQKIASDPNTPEEFFEKLANCGDPKICLQVANNTDISPKLRENLLENFLESDIEEEEEVATWLREIASDPKTPEELLEKLANSKNLTVCLEVAKNPNTSEESLEKLAKNEHWEVRLEVAKNPYISPELLEILEDDEDLDVREEVAFQKLDMQEIDSDLEKLIYHDYDEDLAERLDELSPRVLRSLAWSINPEIGESIAKYKNLPSQILEELAFESPVFVRAEIAGRSDLSNEIFNKLATDEDTEVRARVARNQKTPAPILEKLAEDEHHWVREEVAANPNTPNYVLEKLANDPN